MKPRTVDSAQQHSARDSMRFAGRLVAPHRARLAGIAGVLLVEAGAGLALPLLAGRIVDRLADGLGVPAGLGLLLAALLLVQFGARIAGRLGAARIGDEMLIDLRLRTFEHLQSLPVGVHDRRKRGDLLSLLTTDAQALSQFLSNALPGLLPAVLTLAGAMAVLAWMRPVLALLIVLGVGLATIGLKFWMRSIRRRARAWFDAQSETVDVAEQAIELLPLIKAEAREARQSALFRDRAAATLERARDLRSAMVPLQPTLQLVSLAGIVVLLWLGAGPGSAVPAGPGELVTLLLYGVLIARPMATVAELHGRWNSARAALARILEVLALRPEGTGGRKRPPERLRDGIAFRGITFAYGEGRPVFDGFDLEIGAGERIALTGPNGSGKSTLIALLLRFHAPQRGRIEIDGTPLEAFSLPHLRRAIALVPQRVWLFQGSIAENIRLAWPDAPDERVREAARLAGAESFIRRLPDGWNTMLGPRGSRISGGQQQRLALARALLRPTPVLVLDEATSMFDDPGEADLVERIGPAIAERTMLMVTHRPRLLALADRVIRLQDPATDSAGDARSDES